MATLYFPTNGKPIMIDQEIKCSSHYKIRIMDTIIIRYIAMKEIEHVRNKYIYLEKIIQEDLAFNKEATIYLNKTIGNETFYIVYGNIYIKKIEE